MNSPLASSTSAWPRRTFLRHSSMAVAAAMTASLPSGRAAAPSANARIGLALIGCGGRGNAVLGQFLKSRAAWNIEVVALCDVWKVALQETADKVAADTGRRPQTFSRHRDLLQRPEVDAVIIATPDSSHSLILIDAARARKHAYVEKPMATRLEDANAAVDAVEQSGIVCQVGTQFRSMGNFIGAARVMHSGVLGQLVKVETSYNRSTPSWERDYARVQRSDVDWEQFRLGLPPAPFDARQFRCWQLYRDYSVGLAGLLGVHVIDLGTWLANDPLPQTAVGLAEKIVWKDRELPDSIECLFRYPRGFILQLTSRLGNGNPTPEINFFGTKGTLRCPFSATARFTVTGDGGGSDKLAEPLPIEPVTAPTHAENWLQCIRANRRQTAADVHAGYAHSIASIMGSRSAESGRKITFDAAKRTFSS